MPILLLVRHGENEYVKTGRLAGRLPGVHLNEKGRQQAAAVAAALSANREAAPLAAVYSSPLDRTMETAQPIAQALGLPVIPRPGLMEMDMGEWQDQRVKSLSRLKIWRMVQMAPSLTRFPGGESFTEAQFRISKELADLAGQHEVKETIVCVSHADPIKLGVAYFLGLPIDLFQRLSVSPGSITALMISHNSSRLLTLNYELSFALPKA